MRHIDDAIATLSGVVTSVILNGYSTIQHLHLQDAAFASLKTFLMGAIGGAGGYLTKKLIDKIIYNYKLKKQNEKKQ